LPFENPAADGACSIGEAEPFEPETLPDDKQNFASSAFVITIRYPVCY
jgi:hypothetical protein